MTQPALEDERVSGQGFTLFCWARPWLVSLFAETKLRYFLPGARGPVGQRAREPVGHCFHNQSTIFITVPLFSQPSHHVDTSMYSCRIRTRDCSYFTDKIPAPSNTLHRTIGNSHSTANIHRIIYSIALYRIHRTYTLFS